MVSCKFVSNILRYVSLVTFCMFKFKSLVMKLSKFKSRLYLEKKWIIFFFLFESEDLYPFVKPKSPINDENSVFFLYSF